MDGRVSNLQQVASLRRYTLTEGRGKGLDVIDCDNGKIRFLLNVTKALDIMQLYHKGQNMSFLSKNAFTAHELPFGRRFEGGMLYTCGLDSVGSRAGYDMHGTIHNISAEIIRAECDENRLIVEAVVRDTALFGQNLVLKRKITATVGAEEVMLEDTLVNEGFRDESYCLLYHINIGYPMLDDGAMIKADIAENIPRNAWAEQNKSHAFMISAPVSSEEETCYFLKLNKPEMSLINNRIGKKLTVVYSGDTLPCLVAWRSMASGDYAFGIEPSTTYLDDKFSCSMIKAQESIVFNAKISISEL